MQGHKLVAAIVPKGAAGKAMEAAREAGTILLARGTGVHEARRFFGISPNSERELLILLEPEKKGRFSEPWWGPEGWTSRPAASRSCCR